MARQGSKAGIGRILRKSFIALVPVVEVARETTDVIAARQLRAADLFAKVTFRRRRFVRRRERSSNGRVKRTVQLERVSDRAVGLEDVPDGRPNVGLARQFVDVADDEQADSRARQSDANATGHVQKTDLSGFV